MSCQITPLHCSLGRLNRKFTTVKNSQPVSCFLRNSETETGVSVYLCTCRKRKEDTLKPTAAISQQNYQNLIILFSSTNCSFIISHCYGNIIECHNFGTKIQYTYRNNFTVITRTGLCNLLSTSKQMHTSTHSSGQVVAIVTTPTYPPTLVPLYTNT